MRTGTGILAALTLAAGLLAQTPPTPTARPAPAPAQPPPAAPTPAGSYGLKLQEVVELHGATADQLYGSVVRWFSQPVEDHELVLQVRIPETSLLGKARFAYGPPSSVGKEAIAGYVTYSVTVEVREGRYRYTLDDFVHEGTARKRSGPISFGALTTDDRCPRPIPGLTRGETEEIWTHLQTVAAGEGDKLAQTMKRTVGAGESW